MSVNKVTVLTALNNLSGKRNQPSGTQDDLVRYCQHAFDYAWKYHKWGFSIQTADVAPNVDGVTILPDDFDADLFHQAIGGNITELPLADVLSSNSTSTYAIRYDRTLGKYITTPAITATMVYQTVPPTLTEDVNEPFPSSMVIAMGALIYKKNADNPTRADIQQEWDLFHKELDRLVSLSYNANTTKRARNRYDLSGIGTGES